MYLCKQLINVVLILCFASLSVQQSPAALSLEVVSSNSEAIAGDGVLTFSVEAENSGDNDAFEMDIELQFDLPDGEDLVFLTDGAVPRVDVDSVRVSGTTNNQFQMTNKETVDDKLKVYGRIGGSLSGSGKMRVEVDVLVGAGCADQSSLKSTFKLVRGKTTNSGGIVDLESPGSVSETTAIRREIMLDTRVVWTSCPTCESGVAPAEVQITNRGPSLATNLQVRVEWKQFAGDNLLKNFSSATSGTSFEANVLTLPSLSTLISKSFMIGGVSFFFVGGSCDGLDISVSAAVMSADGFIRPSSNLTGSTENFFGNVDPSTIPTDLSVSVEAHNPLGTDDEQRFVAGSGAGNVEFIVTLTNNADSCAFGIDVRTKVMHGTRGYETLYPVLDSGSFSGWQRWEDRTAEKGSWFVDYVKSGDSQQMVLRVTADEAARPGRKELWATAYIAPSSVPDVNTEDNFAKDAVDIWGLPNLTIRKRDNKKAAVAGDGTALVHTIDVIHVDLGPYYLNASGVRVRDKLDLPAEGVYLQNTDCAWEGCTVEQNEQHSLVWFTLGAFPKGSSAQITLFFSVEKDAKPGVHEIVDHATVLAAPPIASAGDRTLRLTTDDTITEFTSVERRAFLEISYEVEKTKYRSHKSRRRSSSSSSDHDDHHLVEAIVKLTLRNTGPSNVRAAAFNQLITLPEGAAVYSLVQTSGSVIGTVGRGYNSKLWAVPLECDEEATLTTVIRAKSGAGTFTFAGNFDLDHMEEHLTNNAKELGVTFDYDL